MYKYNIFEKGNGSLEAIKVEQAHEVCLGYVEAANEAEAIQFYKQRLIDELIQVKSKTAASRIEAGHIGFRDGQLEGVVTMFRVCNDALTTEEFSKVLNAMHKLDPTIVSTVTKYLAAETNECKA